MEFYLQLMANPIFALVVPLVLSIPIGYGFVVLTPYITYGSKRKYYKKVTKRLDRLLHVRLMHEHGTGTYLLISRATNVIVITISTMFSFAVLLFVIEKIRIDYGNAYSLHASIGTIIVSSFLSYANFTVDMRYFETRLLLLNPRRFLEDLQNEVGNTHKGDLLSAADKTEVSERIKRYRSIMDAKKTAAIKADVHGLFSELPKPDK